jgi:protein-tyrosine-phosphatase
MVTTMKKKTVLFISSFNSVRSQMTEGFLNARCKDLYTAFSAGIAPAGLNPYAVAVMKEAGIDISAQKSKQLFFFLVPGSITSSPCTTGQSSRYPGPSPGEKP